MRVSFVSAILFFFSLCGLFAAGPAHIVHENILEFSGEHKKNAFDYLFESYDRNSLSTPFVEYRPKEIPFDLSKQLKPLRALQLRIVRSIPINADPNRESSAYYLIQIESKTAMEKLNYSPAGERSKFLPTASLLMLLLEKWRLSGEVNESWEAFKARGDEILSKYPLSSETPETYIFAKDKTSGGNKIIHLFPFYAAEFLITQLNWTMSQKVEIKTIDFSAMEGGYFYYQRLLNILRQSDGNEPLSYAPGSYKLLAMPQSGGEVDPVKLMRIPGDRVVLFNPALEVGADLFPDIDWVPAPQEKEFSLKHCLASLKKLFQK